MKGSEREEQSCLKTAVDVGRQTAVMTNTSLALLELLCLVETIRSSKKASPTNSSFLRIEIAGLYHWRGEKQYDTSAIIRFTSLY